MTDLPVTEVLADDGEPIAVPLGSRTRSTARRVTDALLGYLFLLPALVVFGLFAFFPLGRLVFDSVHRQPRFLNRPPTYQGFGQLKDTLTSDQFTSGLTHSAQFMLYSVPLGLVLGVLLAVAAHRRLRGIKVFQAIFSSTVASSVAVSSVVFLTLVNEQIGLLRNVSWLSLKHPTSALFAAALSSVWQNIGLTFVIVLAALQTVPDEVLEAAHLDGYGAARRFFKVVVPLISPALMFLAVVLVIQGFQAYAQIELITGGGPLRATETLLFKITKLQKNTDLQVGASMSLGLFGLTFLVAVAQFWLLERRVTYAD